MKPHECIIGVCFDYEDTQLVTARDIEKIVDDEIELSKYYTVVKRKDKRTMMKEYFDKRYSTNLERFDYCPICGKPIPWKVFRILAVGGEAK